MKNHLYLYLFLIAGMLFSCQQNEPVLDEIGPEITILAPKKQDAFSPGEEMQIHLEIQENLGLHGYFIWIVHTESGEPFLIDKSHIHASYHVVDQVYTIGDVMGGDYEIVVEATDHESNRTIETVVIQIK
jgi:hypothetical protein